MGLTGSTINIKGAAYTTSDRRLKDDITDVTDATAAIDRLHGVRYSWVKEAPGADGTKRRFLGFLAQEVEDVLPELVSTDAEGTKSVNYVGVVPVLVEALKEERAARTAPEARLDAVGRPTAATPWSRILFLARLRHVRDHSPHVRRAGAPFPQDLRQPLHLRLELVHRRGAGALEIRGAAYSLYNRRAAGRSRGPRRRVGLPTRGLVRVPVPRLAVPRAIVRDLAPRALAVRREHRGAARRRRRPGRPSSAPTLGK